MEEAVLKFYKAVAKEKGAKLCCPVTPVSYRDSELLKIIPQEILERDYGCGDPTQYVREGEIVLDLGCGSGKHCYIIAQKVGPRGKVIGVDFNDEMLALARKYQQEIAQKLGYWNTEFRKAKIQNLRLDLDKVDAYLRENPINNAEDLIRFEAFIDNLEKTEPLILDNSIDTVVSNCVLNLVKPEDKERLFSEIYRVLKPEGRAVISDIVSDKDVPLPLQRDPELWASCISGALREDRFLEAFLRAGFVSVQILGYQREPWQVIEGIEFRSITVEAYKGERADCREQGQVVIYVGPFKKVEDAEGHIFEVGKRVSVCKKTFNNLKRFAPDHFIFIESSKVNPLEALANDNGEVVYSISKDIKRGPGENSGTINPCCLEGRITGLSFKSFDEKLKELKISLRKEKVEVVQLNLGYRCNEKCLHCHLKAQANAPLMEERVLEAIFDLLKSNPSLKVDITGGAPELHPLIGPFLEKIAPYAKEIFFRTNLTALENRKELLEIFKSKDVRLIASFPDIYEERVDYYRGKGFFRRALKVLKMLSREGFGKTYPLYLMVNPTDFSLVKSKFEIEDSFRTFLSKEDIYFTDILVLNNLPLGRFREHLAKVGKLSEYYQLLYQNFNERTLNHLMCKNLINISPEGVLYDCDFNQASGMRLDFPESVFALRGYGLQVLEGKPIKVGDHCYGCSALFGTGCFGALT